jgi:hypothetical protein
VAQGCVHQFVDRDRAAVESGYRKSAALGGDKQLANLTDDLFKHQKYAAAIEPLTARLASNSPRQKADLRAGRIGPNVP